MGSNLLQEVNTGDRLPKFITLLEFLEVERLPVRRVRDALEGSFLEVFPVHGLLRIQQENVPVHSLCLRGGRGGGGRVWDMDAVGVGDQGLVGSSDLEIRR